MKPRGCGRYCRPRIGLPLSLLNASFNGSEAQDGNEPVASGTFTFLAFFLMFCSAAAGLFTIYLIKWEIDRLRVLRKLYKRGIPVTGHVFRRDPVAIAQRKRQNMRRLSALDPVTGLTGEQRHGPKCTVDVNYEVEDESDGTLRQYRAEFHDEGLHKAIKEGGPVQLLVHSHNHLIARPIGSSNSRSWISRDSSGNVGSLCEIAVGSLSLVTATFSVTFGLLIRELFTGDGATLTFNEENPLGWILFSIALTLLFVPLFPRLRSSVVTEMEFETAIEVRTFYHILPLFCLTFPD
jgi:hypothetical protein